VSPVLGCAASMTTECKVGFNTYFRYTHSWMLMQLYWEKSKATDLTYSIQKIAKSEKNRKINIRTWESLKNYSLLNVYRKNNDQPFKKTYVFIHKHQIQ
jgi:hypothetical protein